MTHVYLNFKGNLVLILNAIHFIITVDYRSCSGEDGDPDYGVYQ